MPLLSAPRLRLWPPSAEGVEASAGSTVLNDPGDGAGFDRSAADAGQGVLRPSRPRGGIQIRRNTGPSVISAACRRCRRARTGQSSVLPWGIATVTPRLVRSPLGCGRVRRRPARAAAIGARIRRRMPAVAAGFFAGNAPLRRWALGSRRRGPSQDWGCRRQRGIFASGL